MHLKRDAETRILTLGRKAPAAKQLLDYLFGQPVLTAADVAEHMGLSTVTRCRLIADFQRLGILTEATGFKRNRLFLFQDYLDVFHR